LKTKLAKSNSSNIKTRREEEILDAASKLFAECGYSGADTQTLADRLGVGKGTIYRYFPSKRVLFLAAVDRLSHRLHESITASINDIENPIDRMYHAIKAYLNFFAEQPQFVELMIQERAYFKDRSKPTYFEHREQFACKWQEEFNRLVADGRIRDMPFEKFHDVFSDLLYGTMFTNYFVQRKRATTEQARDIFDITLRGILTDSERKERRMKDEGKSGQRAVDGGQ
jgi:AcrR family transcriptional regulator